MSSKKITFSTKPSQKHEPVAADAWVESRSSEEPVKMKRLTIDISESMHRRIKSQCAINGTKIADEVRELLMQKYGSS